MKPKAPAPVQMPEIPNTADQIRRETEQKEAERQAAIRQGAGMIDQSFSKFNEPFFQGFQDNFLNYYTPQIDEQLRDARATLATSLADRGMLESTTGLSKLADLEKSAARQRTDISNRAVDEANNLRSQVEQERANLIALNESAANPSRIGTLVRNSAATLKAPQSFSPLGDVFATALDSVAQFNNAARNSPSGRGLFDKARPATSANQSGRVVGN